MTAQAPPAIGHDFLGYRPEAVIGRGGMGVVYRARDLRLKRTVALKLMSPELATDQRFRERFEREAELAMSLEHPNVVPIHDAGAVDGRLYLVMRYVEGTDLRALLRSQGALEPARALALVAQVAQALDAAHANGLVHRDVKPSNVLLDRDEHVYLADFGLTRPIGEASVEGGDARSLGTPAYLAPEQIEGRAIDGRADVYSLGCLLYECLTGVRPFAAPSRLAVAWAHLEEEPPSISAQNSQLPEALDGVVCKAMAKDPDDRYATCAELVAAAAAALGLDRHRRRRRRTALIAAAALVAVAAVLVATVVARGDGEPAASLAAGPNTLIRVDPATNTIAAAIDVGEFPSGLATAGDRVWVYNLADRTVSEIDAKTNDVRHTTELSTMPPDLGEGAGPVLAADAGGAWTIGRGTDGAVLTRVLSDGRGKREYPLAAEPTSIAVARRAVVVLTSDGRRDVIVGIEPRTGAVTWQTHLPQLAGGERADALTVGGGFVWVTTTQNGTVHRLDPRTGNVRSRDLGDVTFRPVFGFGRLWVCVDGVMRSIHPRTLDDTVAGKGLGGEREYVAGYGSLWRHDGASATLMRFDPRSGDLVALAPLSISRHEVAVTSLAAGAGGVWLTLAKFY